MLSSLFSSFIVHADAPNDADESNKADSESKSENGGQDDKEEEVVEEGVEEKEEEEPEEEPEDIHPVLREECDNSAKCAGFKKHFEHCQEKVQAGNGFKGEDCVEEILMHCADGCVAPKLFSKLR